MRSQIFINSRPFEIAHLLEIAHLNAELLKCRQHFTETKELALERDFDILTISETWFNSSVTNSAVEIPGYKVFRLDRLGKAGAGVCAHLKSTLKVLPIVMVGIF